MELFGCSPGAFPMRYLGIPIHIRKLSNTHWLKVRRKNIMSFFEIAKGVIKKLDYFQSQSLWQCDEYKRKYYLAKWDILCHTKDQGGLGIHKMEIKNTTFLSKWLYRLLKAYDTWQQMLGNKYLGTRPLVQV
jgi:hypothetical protein